MTAEAMFSFDSLLEMAARALRDWRGQPTGSRLDALETYALSEIVMIRPGAECLDLWDYPQPIAAHIILDFGCREEACRRGHDFNASIECAAAQALALQDFRNSLDAALSSVADWSTFLDAARPRTQSK